LGAHEGGQGRGLIGTLGGAVGVEEFERLVQVGAEHGDLVRGEQLDGQVVIEDLGVVVGGVVRTNERGDAGRGADLFGVYGSSGERARAVETAATKAQSLPSQATCW
jgi:hypothetical protein